MPDITVTLSDAENRAMEYAAVSVQEWADNALKHRAEIAKDEIIDKLIKHCNANNVAIATGEDAQVAQAYELEVVKTAAARNAEAEAAENESP